MSLLNRIGTRFRRRQPAAVPPEQFLLEFLRGLARVVEEEPLGALATSRLREWLDADRVLLFTRRDQAEEYRCLAREAGAGQDPLPEDIEPLPPDSHLASWIARNAVPLYLPDYPGVENHFTTRERQLLETLAIDLCLPLPSLHQLNGFLLVGGVAPEKVRAVEEESWARIILTQIGLALEHAHLVARQRARLRQMYWADRLAIAGQLAAGAAHEIRNPLTVIRSTVQHLTKRLAEASQRDQMNNLLSEVDRIDAIVQGMLSFARPGLEREEMFAVGDELTAVLDLLAAQARKARVELIAPPSYPELNVHGDRAKIRQVFLNLAMNALQAMPEGGSLSVSLQSRNDGQGERAVVRFEDTGTGIAAEDIENIFDPFYTTRREGTGLGLSISYGIVNQHGGAIMVESEPGEGTVFTVELPVADAETAEGAAGQQDNDDSDGGEISEAE